MGRKLIYRRTLTRHKRANYDYYVCDVLLDVLKRNGPMERHTWIDRVLGGSRGHKNKMVTFLWDAGEVNFVRQENQCFIYWAKGEAGPVLPLNTEDGWIIRGWGL